MCYTMHMLREKILKRLAIAIVSLAAINFLGGFFSWYSIEWWFDMPMHFLGGISVLYISAVLWLPALKRVSRSRYTYECLITAVLFGVLWEALELYLHLRFGSPQFILRDSISDVFFDLAGAFWAMFLLMPIVYDEHNANN